MTSSEPTPTPTRKSDILRKLLRRKAGAEMAALAEATGWQAHSVRAALSGLRKAGYTIERSAPTKPGGTARYRIIDGPEAGR